MKCLKYLLFAAALSGACASYAQYPPVYKSTESAEHAQKMQWWRDAKFGMFMHWGVYSVSAGMWGDRVNHTEWLMQEARISRKDYQELPHAFNPVNFNADDWADLMQAAGQKYFVFTTKHHDGFAMYDTKVDTFSVCGATPYRKDIFAALCPAVRARGLHMCAYYSQGNDWNHKGGEVPGYQYWDSTLIGDFSRYIEDVAKPQLNEILNNYGPIDLLWYDANSSRFTIPQCREIDSIAKSHPRLITNNRLDCQRRDFNGDYFTPEQYIPQVAYPDNDWELCLTMNRHWMYCAYDDNWKSSDSLIRALAEVVSKGGNLLLNVGPDRYGNIPDICRRTLLEIGSWLKTNGESIYGTSCSPYQYLPFGWATRKGNMLYLHVRDWQKEISLPEKLRVKKAYLLAYPEVKVSHRVCNGRSCFRLPEICPDRRDAVLAVECAAPVQQLPVPSESASVSWNGAPLTALNDGDFMQDWKSGAMECVFEIRADEPMEVRCLKVVESFHLWQHQGQYYTLEVLDNGNWRTLFTDGFSDGVGFTQVFAPVKAQSFRLKVRGVKGPVALKEILLVY